MTALPPAILPLVEHVGRGTHVPDPLAELKAKVAAHCEQSRLAAEQRARECAEAGHRLPSWRPSWWESKAVHCEHCGAVMQG